MYAVILLSVYHAWFLTPETSQLSISVGNEATIAAHVSVYMPQSGNKCCFLAQGVFIHDSVGFCVARSTEMGNAKASGVERVTDTDSHAFCVMCAIEN